MTNCIISTDHLFLIVEEVVVSCKPDIPGRKGLACPTVPGNYSIVGLPLKAVPSGGPVIIMDGVEVYRLGIRVFL